MPIRLCAECNRPVRDAGSKGRCDEHYCALERKRSARRRQTTKGVYAKKKWATTRRKVFARDPICKVCDRRTSEEIDHIKPLSLGGDPYDLEGLQGICKPCHWTKTARENA